MTNYPPTFYQTLQESVHSSAEAVVPLVMDLVTPQSVLDVGCGLGTWLAVFQEHGVSEVFGVDGSHIDLQMLDIPPQAFDSFDLTKPLQLDRRFDLVVSLEVGEHLPPECAETFVNSLIRHGPAVLFSAAIPFQEGRHHVNEQWPDYWAELFGRKQYVAVDCLRRRVWNDTRVQWWYVQNMLLFIRGDKLATYSALLAERERTPSPPLPLVHPAKHLETMQAYRQCLEELWELKTELAGTDLRKVIPSGESLILVDQGQLTKDIVSGYTAFPFPEKDGEYAGPPADDVSAIQELCRLQQSGAGFIAFAWPAFWWLDHHAGLTSHLRSNYRCLLENNRLVVFDLRP